MDDRLLKRYARLVIEAGVNLKPGQDLYINALVEHAPVARAATEAAYEAGAGFVYVKYWDQHSKLQRLRHAPQETLGFVPGWYDRLYEELVERRAAILTLNGDPEPELLSGQPPERLAADRMPTTPKALQTVFSREVNWCIVAAPNEGWARQVYGEPDMDRLWKDVSTAVRLDEPDPVAAWNSHIEMLLGRAAKLNGLRVDELHFHGGGTDLRVGLMRQSRWVAARFETNWGQAFIPNMPTEEVFTTPDFRRTSGVVRSTKPLICESVMVEDLRLTFEGGVCTDVQAARGAEVVVAQMQRDEGAKRLGEISIVDAASAVGRTGTLFRSTLFDENAACHMAWGAGIAEATEGLPDDGSAREAAGLNSSTVHTDVMIGGPEVDVDAVTADGRTVPVLRDNVWQL